MNQLSEQSMKLSSLFNKHLGLITLVGLSVIILILTWKCKSCKENFANSAERILKPTYKNSNGTSGSISYHNQKITRTGADAVIISVFLPKHWGVIVGYQAPSPYTRSGVTSTTARIEPITTGHRDIGLQYPNAFDYTFFIRNEKIAELAAQDAADEKAKADAAAAAAAAARAAYQAPPSAPNTAVASWAVGTLFNKENKNAYTGPTLMLENNGYIYYRTLDPNTSLSSTRLLTLPNRVWRGTGRDPVTNFKQFNIAEANFLLIPDNFTQKVYLYPDPNFKGYATTRTKGYQGSISAFQSLKLAA